VPRWLPRALTRIRGLALAGRVRFTYKAFFELQELGLGRDDVVEVLSALRTRDSAGRVQASRLNEWLYCFRPCPGGVEIYLKVALRGDCLVISCHEDEPAEE
jgi:hypothetical protein